MENLSAKKRLPDEDSVFIIGIVALASSFFVPVLSLIPGIMGIIMANKSLEIYNADKESYELESASRVKTGKKLSKIANIITFALLAFILLIIFIIIAIGGLAIFNLN